MSNMQSAATPVGSQPLKAAPRPAPSAAAPRLDPYGGRGAFGSNETNAASQAKVSALASSDEQMKLKAEMAAPKPRARAAAGQTAAVKRLTNGLGLGGGVKKASMKR
jgi:hypothetical protein